MKPDSAPSHFTRRGFLGALGAGAGAAFLSSQVSTPAFAAAATTPSRRLKIGHTGITWTDAEVLTAIKELGALGYEGLEPFGWVAQPWEETKAVLGPHLKEAKLPLISEYTSIALHDPTKRKAEIENSSA